MVIVLHNRTYSPIILNIHTNTTTDDFWVAKMPPTRIIITAQSEQERVDFVSRFFAPRFGIDEDPVTGSAHCSLTPFWASRLGKTQMAARQLSTRGGELEVELANDRVKLRGTCVTTLRGNLTDSAPSASTWSSVR